ncbi:hypothetical protein RP20_CCG000804 [Aedes albopictus]|nr:hypothetical protein RP20_CCG000804 [Aedes albopictus]
MANVTCEYDSSGNSSRTSTNNNGSLPTLNSPSNVDGSSSVGRRVRRSEAILRQAAECVSRGETFQTVSDMFNIPISTIRFYMARKGILPRRKRGRTAILPYVLAGTSHAAHATTTPSTSTNSSSSNNITIQNQHFPPQQHHSRSRSASPLEPPFHFANYKLPELRPKLV